MKCGRSNAVRSAVLILLLLGGVRASRAAGVYAYPANLYLDAAAGATIEEHIHVAVSAPQAEVRLSLSAFTFDERGTPRSCRCRTDRSIEAWSALSVSKLTVADGRYGEVGVRLAVPAAASGSYWGAILIESDALAIGPAAKARIAIPVFVTVRGTEDSRIQIENLVAYGAADGGIDVAATIVNEGSTLLHGPALLLIEDPRTVPATELASDENVMVTVLPGSSRTVRIHIPGGATSVESRRAALIVRTRSGANIEKTVPVVPVRPCVTSSCVSL